MVELYVFAPDEDIDETEFAEVILRTPVPLGTGHAAPVVLDSFGEARGACRFAVRRAGFEANAPAPVSPLSVRCPLCESEPWDPCVTRSVFGEFHPRVSLYLHSERRAAAKGAPQQ